jgi:hypothetical protein
MAAANDVVERNVDQGAVQVDVTDLQRCARASAITLATSSGDVAMMV